MGGDRSRPGARATVGLPLPLCLPPSLEASYQGKMGPGSPRGDRPAPPTTNAKGECGPVRPDLPREAEHTACYVEIARV